MNLKEKPFNLKDYGKKQVLDQSPVDPFCGAWGTKL